MTRWWRTTIRERDSLEPRFVLPDQEARAAAALDAYRSARGAPEHPRRPLRRRGLGRLRVLRRRRGRRCPDPEHRPAGPARPAAHVVLLRAVVHAVAGVAHDRPAAHAPRPAAAADVRPAGRARRRGDPRLAAVRRRLRHPGGGQVAHRRERRVAAPERRLRRLLRLPVRVGHVHRVARPELLPRDRLQRGAHAVGREPALQQVLRPRHPRRRDRERRGGHRPGAVAPRRQVGRLLARLHPAHGRPARRRPPPWFLYHCTRGAHFDNYPPRALPRLVAGQAPLQGHHHRARRHRGSPGGRARGDGPDGRHPDLRQLGQRPRDGDLARRRLLARSAAPRARPGRAASGCRAS